MNRLVNTFILFISLGFKAHGLHDRGMVYGFDNVSPVPYGTTSPKRLKLLTNRLD
jgi:hypothetical protein